MAAHLIARRVFVTHKGYSAWMWELRIKGKPGSTPSIYPSLNDVMDRVYLGWKFRELRRNKSVFDKRHAF